MLKLKGIKKYFKDEDKYLDFLYAVNNIWYDYTTEYAFLGIREESWNTLFNNIVIVCLRDKKPDKISDMIKEKVLTHLIEQLSNKNYKIIINILKILYNQGLRRKNLLQAFFRRLEFLNISINDDIYSELKQQSFLLQKVLKSIGAFDMGLMEMKSYIKEKNNVYDLFFSRGRTYEEVRDKVDYILSCVPDKEMFKNELLKKHNNRYLGVVKRIIDNYEIIISIYELFKEKVGFVDLSLFLKNIILKYTEKEVSLLIEQFKLGKNLDYIYILANRIGYDKIKLNSKIDNKKKVLESADSIYNKSNLSKSTKPKIEAEVVDKSSALLSSENEGQQQMVYDEVDEILKDDSKLQEMSKDAKEDSVKKTRVRKRLYERFPLSDEINEEMRKKIVDILFKRRSKEEQELINHYIAGDKLNKKDRKLVFNIVSYMQVQYKKLGKKVLLEYKLEYFAKIMMLIKSEFGISLLDVSLEKKDILYDALRVIEYIYRNNLEMLKVDYDSYMIKRLLELFCNDGCRTLEDLVLLYINSEYKIINEVKKSRE